MPCWSVELPHPVRRTHAHADNRTGGLTYSHSQSALVEATAPVDFEDFDRLGIPHRILYDGLFHRQHRLRRHGADVPLPFAFPQCERVRPGRPGAGCPAAAGVADPAGSDRADRLLQCGGRTGSDLLYVSSRQSANRQQNPARWAAVGVPVRRGQRGTEVGRVVCSRRDDAD